MLLIVQNGLDIPCIPKYLDEEYEIIKSYEYNVSEIDLNKYTIVIILGGYQSVTSIHQYPYLYDVVKLINKCIETKKPLFGICLGCQLIAFSLGCQIKSSTKLNIGYDAKIMDYKNIFRSHIDYIIPNALINISDYFDTMPYLYTYQNYVYGIQCHPDVSPECVQRYCNNSQCKEYANQNKNKIDATNKAVMTEILNKLRQNIKKIE